MKKFISLMICVAMILSSVSAMADSDSLIVNTVKVNVSSGSVTLNGFLLRSLLNFLIKNVKLWITVQCFSV